MYHFESYTPIADRGRGCPESPPRGIVCNERSFWRKRAHAYQVLETGPDSVIVAVRVPERDRVRWRGNGLPGSRSRDRFAGRHQGAARQAVRETEPTPPAGDRVPGGQRARTPE